MQDVSSLFTVDLRPVTPKVAGSSPVGAVDVENRGAATSSHCSPDTFVHLARKQTVDLAIPIAV